MNLVQMRHPRYFKAFVCIFNTQMNGTTKIEELAEKRIVLDRVAKVGGECLIQILKAS